MTLEKTLKIKDNIDTEELTILDRLEKYTEEDPHASILYDEIHTIWIAWVRRGSICL